VLVCAVRERRISLVGAVRERERNVLVGAVNEREREKSLLVGAVREREKCVSGCS